MSAAGVWGPLPLWLVRGAGADRRGVSLADGEPVMVLSGKWGYPTPTRHTKVLGADPIGKRKPKRASMSLTPGRAQSDKLLCDPCVGLVSCHRDV